MNEPKRELWYTYQELLDEVVMEDVAMPRYPHDSEMSSDWFTKLIEAGELEFAVYTLSEFFPDDLLNQIVNALMGVVYNRHANDYVAMVEPTDDESFDLNAAMYQALQKLIGVIDLTIPKYVPMLQQTEIASTAPLTPNVDEYSEEASGENENSSDTNGKTRTNDTPQDGGDFDDDEHSTNVVDNVGHVGNAGEYSSSRTSSSSTNVGTLMSRLAEMYANFHSVILEWSNEFNQLFFKEEQL